MYRLAACLLIVGMTDAAEWPIEIDVKFSVDSRRAWVALRVGPTWAELPVAQARHIGEMLVGAATEAETQGFLLEWFTRKFGALDQQQATALAMQFRQFLMEQRDKAQDGPGPPSR